MSTHSAELQTYGLSDIPINSEMKILLIEDNRLDQMFLTQSLNDVADFDHQIVNCRTLGESLERLAVTQFDVILLDLWLPDSGGLETCERVVAAARTCPVVVLTGTDDLALASGAIRGGAQDYLVKGAFPGPAIVRVLQYAIDRLYAQRQLSRREHFIQQLLHCIPAIIWTTNRELTIESVTGAGLEILSFNADEMVGQSLTEHFFINGDSAGALEAHQQAIAGRAVAFESEWKGRIFTVKVEPLYDAERRVTGAIGVALDVTERQHLDREIDFARLIQESLLPAKHPLLDRFEIFGGAYPARKTCGDWFDYLSFPDGSLGLVVGDVCGKGLGPAILSATLATYMEALAERQADLVDIMISSNRMICRRCPDQFAVVSLGKLQAGDLTLTYAGAGEGMLIIDRTGQLKHKLPASAFPLGVRDEIDCNPPVQVELEPGDVLLMLSDGFRDSSNGQGDFFGEAGIVNTVARHVNASANAILKALLHEACEFAQGHHQQDDMTGIVVRVL